MDCRNIGRIFQKSRASIRQFLGIRLQTLIAAKDGPGLADLLPIRTIIATKGDSDLANFRPLRGRV